MRRPAGQPHDFEGGADTPVRIGEAFAVDFRHAHQRRAARAACGAARPAGWRRPCGAGRASGREARRSARSRGRCRRPAGRSRRAAAARPRPRTSANGATRGEAPPSISLSAAAKLWRNSVSVSPPSSAARNRPSGLSARRICTSVAGQVVDRLQRQRRHDEIERAVGRNGSASSSATTCEPISPAPVAIDAMADRPGSWRARGAPHRRASRDRPRARSGAAPWRAARRDPRRRGRAGRSPDRARGRDGDAPAAAHDRKP